MDYISSLNDDVLSIVLQYVLEFDYEYISGANFQDISINPKMFDFLVKNFSNVRHLLNNNYNIYFTLLTNLGLNNEVKKFVINYYIKNQILKDKLLTYRQLKSAIIYSNILLNTRYYSDKLPDIVDDNSFLFTIELSDININILDLDFINVDQIKMEYSFYLNNINKFMSEQLDAYPSISIFKTNNNLYRCSIVHPPAPTYINRDQLRCLLIVLLFHNYNIQCCGDCYQDSHHVINVHLKNK